MTATYDICNLCEKIKHNPLAVLGASGRGCFSLLFRVALLVPEGQLNSACIIEH